MKIVDDCRKCGSKLVKEEKFTAWCPACNWNLTPRKHEPRSSAEKLYTEIGKRSGLKLFEELAGTSHEAMRPRFTLALLFSNIVAGVVHLSTLALFALGLYCIWIDWFNIMLLIVGFLLIVAAWALCPKPGKYPSFALARDDAPQLYAVTDKIADLMGAPRVDCISVSDEINASIGNYGLNRKVHLSLGSPLFLSMSGPEKVALLAHEIAHQVNGDTARGFWVGTALHTLTGWYDFLRQPLHPNAEGVEIITHYMMLLVSLPIYALLSLLSHLYWRQSQRAEYLADYLGSRISGSKAYNSSDRRVEFLGYHYEQLETSLKVHADSPEKIIPWFVERMADPPPMETERVRRVSELELTTLNATHPPTHYRTALVAAFPCEPEFSLSNAENEALNAEVSNVNSELGLNMVRDNLDIL